MHLNYYFLKKLVPELELALKGGSFSEAFSQEKDELILSFATGNGTRAFHIRATLTSSFTCLSFPQDFKRSRKNSVNQFMELEGMTIERISMFLNERAFSIEFGTYSLLFKMHGNRSNIILFHNNGLVSMFKNQLRGDYSIDLEVLNRPISRSLDLFEQQPDYLSFYPTFGKIPSLYLKQHGYHSIDVASQWHLLQSTVSELEKGDFYLIDQNGRPAVSLLNINDGKLIDKSAIGACNQYFRAYTGTYYFEREKHQIVEAVEKKIRQTENYIRKSESKLDKLAKEIQPQQIADILMANLHQIHPRVKKVRLFDFYHNEQIDIKLNPNLSPQKNAENYYRKSKNRKIEIEKTESNVLDKYDILESLKSLKKQLGDIEGHKALRQLAKKHGFDEAGKVQQQESLPYKAFEIEGFQIWIGKNAKANDELSLKYSFKDDIWMHAKDVPGSHVLVKHQAGKVIPKFVIERAAELAAWYSKRKTDSLVPVIMTPAKNVRKRKGSPAGQVIVSKEEVVMVPSRGPSEN